MFPLEVKCQNLKRALEAVADERRALCLFAESEHEQHSWTKEA